MRANYLVGTATLFLSILAVTAYADEKTEKVRQLVEAQGLLEGWSAQMEAGKLAAQTQGQQMLDQVLANLNPNQEFRARFTAAFGDFLKATTTPWTAEYLVEVYASYYGPHFSEDELDQLIAFYTSELGKKDVESTQLAVAEWSRHFQNEGQPIVQDALQKYIERMKLIAQECNCRL